MLYFNRIDVSEGIDVYKTSESKDIFVTIGIFKIKALTFNHIVAIDVIFY